MTAGSTWTAVNTGLTHLNVLCLAMVQANGVPENKHVIYAGTEGGGVYRAAE